MNTVFGFLVTALMFYLLYRRFFAVKNTKPGTAEELQSINNKVGYAFVFRFYGYALWLINANIDRFQGADKANLLNLRGGLRLIKGDKQGYLDDHKLAYELDDNLVNLSNYAEALEKMHRIELARNLAKLGLQNPNLSRRERELFEKILLN